MEQLENGHWRSWARMTSWAAGAERLPEPATWVFEGNTEGKERIPDFQADPEIAISAGQK